VEVDHLQLTRGCISPKSTGAVQDWLDLEVKSHRHYKTNMIKNRLMNTTS